jgi:hypothetical protein
VARLVLLATDFEKKSSPTKELYESIFGNEIYLIVLITSLKPPLSFVVLWLDEYVAWCSPHPLLDLNPEEQYPIGI